MSDVIEGSPVWIEALKESTSMFFPYPGPYIAFSIPEGRAGVLVQPLAYLAGHIIDKWNSVNVDDPATQIESLAR